MRNAKYIALLVSLLLLVLTTYSLFNYLSNPPTYRGWYVSRNDVIKYELMDMHNDSLRTVIDDIYSEYRLDILEQSSFGTSEFAIKILDLPHEINITNFLESILSLNANLSVARILGNQVIEIHKHALPFAVPVGYWNNIIDSWERIISGKGSFRYHYNDITNEYEFNIYYKIGSKTVSLWIVWDRDKGTLEAMSIRVTLGVNYDYLSIALSGTHLARDLSWYNFWRVSIGFLLSLAFISLLVIVISLVFLLMHSGELKISKQSLSAAEVNQLNELLNRHKFFIIITVIANHFLGFTMFISLTQINIETKITSLIVIVIFIFTPFITSLILDYHIRIKLYRHFFIVYMSFLNGILLWMVSILLISITESPLVFLILLVLLMILGAILLYVIFRDYRKIIKEFREKYIKQGNLENT